MFGFGRCRGCDARAEEVKHLLGQLEQMNKMLQASHDRVVESVSPGATLRAVHSQKASEKPANGAEGPRRIGATPPTFPGYPAARIPPAVELDE